MHKMGRMTDKAISVLYENGKKVYNGELELNEAIRRANEECPEVAVSSARHYINWYSKMREGEILTWNSNSKLLLYYANRIIEEEGREAGEKAIQSVEAFAEHAGRAELDREAKKLRTANLAMDRRAQFEEWLRSDAGKSYTENTVRKYIRALEMVEEWLGIHLEKDIFVASLSEYKSLQKRIKETNNYKDVNQSHGNGDLSAALSLYEKFLIELEEGEEKWWPSIEEYDPGISISQWLELLNREDVIGPVWGGVLAMFYDFGGAATCTQLGQKYHKDPAAIRSCATQLARKIKDITACPLYSGDKKEKYWTILFQGRHASDNEAGVWVWKLRPELHEALTAFDIIKYLPKNEDNSMTVKESIETIKNYIASKGFTYDDGLIENFYLCIKSKPFVILAGISGTGKTRLVKLFAEALDAKYKMVAVRPDWSDSTDLFGHTDLNGNFIPGEILDFVHDAEIEPETPYILCLDEMNLARVEYYFSVFLSVIETRDYKNGEIVSDPLITTDKYASDQAARDYYGEVRFPHNLYVIGTVNMDETTFPFSKKVLDRANTIEFNYVDISVCSPAIPSSEAMHHNNEFLVTQYLLLQQAYDRDEDYVKNTCTTLQSINEILRSANAHIGYRVRDEIVFYMLINHESGLLLEDDAMDNEILQKILPRIQGSSASTKNMLCELFKFLAGDYEGFNTQHNDIASGMMRKLESDTVRYKKSAEKVAFMVKRFEEDGFTSYWL